MAEYAGEDADVAWRLCEQLEPMLKELGFKRPSQVASPLSVGEAKPPLYLYDDLEMPLIEVLTDMEFNGIRLDVPVLKKMSETMTVELEQLEKDVYASPGGSSTSLR